MKDCIEAIERQINQLNHTKQTMELVWPVFKAAVNTAEKVSTDVYSKVFSNKQLIEYFLTFTVGLPRQSGKSTVADALDKEPCATKLVRFDLSKNYFGKTKPFGQDIKVIVLDDPGEAFYNQVVSWIVDNWTTQFRYDCYPAILVLKT